MDYRELAGSCVHVEIAVARAVDGDQGAAEVGRDSYATVEQQVALDEYRNVIRHSRVDQPGDVCRNGKGRADDPVRTERLVGRVGEDRFGDVPDATLNGMR